MLLGPGIVPGFLFWACPGGVSDVGMQGFDVEKGEKRVGKDDFDASVRSLGAVNKGNMSGTRVDVRKISRHGSTHQKMSALPLKADMLSVSIDVR